MALTVLVVDDEAGIRRAVGAELEDQGYEVVMAASGSEALLRFAETEVDLVVTDLKMEGVDGLDVLREVKRRRPEAEVLMMTAYGSVESAVRAMKLGAYHYIEKPFDNDELLNLVHRALEQRRLESQVEDLKGQLDQRYAPENIIGVSDGMQAVFARVLRAARSEVTVLVEGESGTGKELIVRALHHQSKRKEGPFVALNCAALPAHLIENELFGHEPGAFTDARQRYLGKFEQASGGTLFLDEIGELPPEAQGKLLRVIQEREVTRIGGSESISVDVRLVAATNQELESLVQRGDFRQDLYYRLNVVAIRLPPLRQRQEDIPLLVDFFIDRINCEIENRLQGVTPRTLELFRQYDWPGNVRELENVLQGAAVMCRENLIQPQDLPLRLQNQVEVEEKDATLAEILSGVERRIIAEALELEQHNRTRTAARLNITRKTLLAKIAAYGLG